MTESAGAWRLVAADLAFPEGPRWHEGRLHCSEIFGGRVVAIDDSSIETQGRQILDLTFANRELVPEVKLENAGVEVAWSNPIALSAKLPGAASFEVYHNMNRLTSVSGEDVTLRVNPSQIGSGPVRLDVAAVMAGPPVQRVWGSPVMVNIGWRPH